MRVYLWFVAVVLALTEAQDPSCCTNCPQFCDPDGTATAPNGQFITSFDIFEMICRCTCKPNWENENNSNPICDQFIPCTTNPPPCDTTGGKLGPNEDETACVCNCMEGFSGPDCSITCQSPDGSCVGPKWAWACKWSKFFFIDEDAAGSCPDGKQCCRPKKKCDEVGGTCKLKPQCGGTVDPNAICFPQVWKVCCV